MTLTAESLLSSPDYFPLQFEGANLVFVRLSRKHYHESIFTLPGRISLASNEQWKVPFAQIVNLFKSQALDLPSPSFLLQIAHCGSTLLARALDMPGTNLIIREPLVLRQFAATTMAATPAERDARHLGLQTLWSLLSRYYGERQPVLIKGNVPVNFLIDEMLELEPKLKGVLLYSDLDDYLVSILKSEERRAWARYVTAEMFVQIQKVLPVKLPAAESLNAAQTGALLWHAQLQIFAKAAARNSEFHLLNSKDLFKDAEQTIMKANRSLQAGLNSDQIQAQLTSDLFTQNAKQPSKSFSSEQRSAELDELLVEYRAEIEHAQEWSLSNQLNQGLNLAATHHL